MCGIVGIFIKNKKLESKLGIYLSKMIDNMSSRGPDSAGFAIYNSANNIKLCKFSLCLDKNIDLNNFVKDIKNNFNHIKTKKISDHLIVTTSSKIESFINYINRKYKKDISIVGYGNSIEIFKQVGNPKDVVKKFGLINFKGSHGIGHTRMATESDVDIRSAHPYWAFPYNDVSVVHNGQITNYWIMRRQMEKKGHRFTSNCDSELLAVYTAHNLSLGTSLEDSLKQSIDEIDGVFTYLVATKDQLGMAKDTMAAKPLVLYESDDLIAMASEEVAIRAILPHEIDTSDPYDEEVRVWQA
jgi:hypothetical protein